MKNHINVTEQKHNFIFEYVLCDHHGLVCTALNHILCGNFAFSIHNVLPVLMQNLRHISDSDRTFTTVLTKEKTKR